MTKKGKKKLGKTIALVYEGPMSRQQHERKQKKKPKPKQISRGIGVSRDDLMRVCALNDPFCPHAAGAKVNDMGKNRTVSYQAHYQMSLTTDVNGNGSILINPGYLYLPSIATSQSVETATFSTALNANPNVLANAAAYRITSYGVIFRRTVAPLNASGMLHIRMFANKNAANLGTVIVNTFNCSDYEDIAMQDAEEVAVRLDRQDMTANEFSLVATTNPDTTNTTWVSPGWNSLLVSVDGGYASNVNGYLEIYTNYECTFAEGNSISQLATPTPVDRAHVTDAINQVSSEAHSIHKKGTEALAKHVAKLAAEALAKKAMSSAEKALIKGMAGM
jgi:hypothetical protein